MGDYYRSTRECTFEQLRPELVATIRAYLDQHDLGPIERGILSCCETTSEKKNKGFLARLIGGGPDPVHYTGLLVTPTWLIWAISGPKLGTVVSAARLKDIEVTAFSSPLIDDTGLEVFGFISGSPERVQAFVGLGAEPAAQRFRATLQAAMEKVGM